MRYLVVLLIIVLLPLRSWAADGMATQMAGSQIAIESGAARAHNTGATASFDGKKQSLNTVKVVPDCHENALAQRAAEGNIDKANSLAGHCDTCVACQACHTVALTPVLPGVTIAFTSLQLRQTSSAMFTSADAALGQKPPIA